MKIINYMYLIPLTGFILAIISLLLCAFAGIGTRLEWWYFRTGLTTLSWSAKAALISAIISLIGIIVLLFVNDKKGLVFGVVGTIIGFMIFGMIFNMYLIGKKVPAIHDITTDTSNPPKFISILHLRNKATNSTEYEGDKIAKLQEKAYPDIKPLIVNLSKASAFTKALVSIKKMNLKIVATDPDNGRIEAYDTTLWMGFKDDVVIRITKNLSGCTVDIRSVSRVGKGDFGTNARRIRKFLKEMQK